MHVATSGTERLATQGQCYAFHSIHGAERIAIPVWHSEGDYSERSSLRVSSLLALTKRSMRSKGVSRRKKSRRARGGTLLTSRSHRNDQPARRREFNKREPWASIPVFFLPCSRLSFSLFATTPHRSRISQRGILIEAAAVNADLPRPPRRPANKSSHRAVGHVNGCNL